jgi:uncharacterized protein (TIGR04255 family)
MRLEEPSFLALLQDTLRAEYPRVLQEQQVAVVMGAGGMPTSMPAGIQWRYKSRDGDWSVVLQRNSAGLETTRYDDYEAFERRLGELLSALAKLEITVCERLGLRYINELEHDEGRRPSDWKHLLREDLLGMASEEFLEGGDLVHAVQDIRTARGDQTLVVRHGYVSGRDEVNRRQPYYLLDLDHFRQGLRDFEEEALLRESRAFHEVISRVFEMTLQPNMREQMRDEGPVDA